MRWRRLKSLALKPASAASDETSFTSNSKEESKKNVGGGGGGGLVGGVKEPLTRRRSLGAFLEALDRQRNSKAKSRRGKAEGGNSGGGGGSEAGEKKPGNGGIKGVANPHFKQDFSPLDDGGIWMGEDLSPPPLPPLSAPPLTTSAPPLPFSLSPLSDQPLPTTLPSSVSNPATRPNTRPRASVPAVKSVSFEVISLEDGVDDAVSCSVGGDVDGAARRGSSAAPHFPDVVYEEIGGVFEESAESLVSDVTCTTTTTTANRARVQTLNSLEDIEELEDGGSEEASAHEPLEEGEGDGRGGTFPSGRRQRGADGGEEGEGMEEEDSTAGTDKVFFLGYE